MSIHLHKEIKRIEKMLLSLSAHAEEALRKSVTAFETQDIVLAHEVIEGDSLIDNLELDVEEECLKALALHQPVAIDLRFIVAVLRINGDLERIGDHAVSIAKRAAYIATHDSELTSYFSFDMLIEKTVIMLKRGIDALIRHDAELAHIVLEDEGIMVSLRRELFTIFLERGKADSENLESYTHCMFVSRYLERIADHAVNIAEDVIYMVKGDIVRHQS